LTGSPAHLQEVLLDLADNLGPADLMKRREFIDAVRNGDWEAAAARDLAKRAGGLPSIGTK
jgi:hypothetical protein